MTHRSYDVAIVGAGMVGAACALEFAEAGLRVAIIEPEIVGGGATAAGMGHLALMDDSPAQFALTHYSQLLWKELAERLPPDAEYFRCGAIWVAASEDEASEVVRKQKYYGERGVAVQVLDPQSLAEAEPNLRRGMISALLLPEDSVVYPPCAARFLVAEAQRLGTEIVLGKRVLALWKNAATLDDGSNIYSEKFVLANGVAVSALAPSVKIQPRKGHLVITDRHPGFIHHQILELGYLKSAHASDGDSVAFNVQPRPTGQVLIGSSRQYGANDSAVEVRVLSAMLHRAVEYMPGLSTLPAIRTWTGLRAATADNLPVIGPAPEAKDVYLAAGHEGLGITTSLGTARLLGDLLLDRTSVIPRHPYLPDRSYAMHV